MKESVSFDSELIQTIKSSVVSLAKAVKSTLGPEGTNVMVLSEVKLPVITNDGVTVAKSYVTSLGEKYPDNLNTRISQLINNVSKNTERIAGDGTTTSITLSESIILEGLKYKEAGFSSVNLVKGIQQATLDVLEKLETKTLSVLDNEKLLLQVSSISANNDNELGKIISEAFLKVGVDGQIEVQDSETDQTYIEIVNGVKYDSGFESNMFINTDNSDCLLDECKILVYEGKLKTIEPVVNLLRDAKNENTSLLIIADDYSEEAISDLTYNKVNAKVKVCAVRSPKFGKAKEVSLEDIATITGATIISKRYGTDLDKLDSSMLGLANTVKIDQNSFYIINENVDKSLVTSKIIKLKEDLKKANEGTEKTELEERIAKLSNGVAILYVSGNTPVEIAEKKYRIEDAINSTRASLEEGVVPGGGVTLLNISKELSASDEQNESKKLGYKLLLKSLEAPIKTICKNAGDNGDIVISKIEQNPNFNFGYDAKSKTYGDLVDLGILDPKKVTRVALQNASSVAQMILTLNCAIY